LEDLLESELRQASTEVTALHALDRSRQEEADRVLEAETKLRSYAMMKAERLAASEDRAALLKSSLCRAELELEEANGARIKAEEALTALTAEAGTWREHSRLAGQELASVKAGMDSVLHAHHSTHVQERAEGHRLVARLELEQNELAARLAQAQQDQTVAEQSHIQSQALLQGQSENAAAVNRHLQGELDLAHETVVSQASQIANLQRESVEERVASQSAERSLRSAVAKAEAASLAAKQGVEMELSSTQVEAAQLKRALARAQQEAAEMEAAFQQEKHRFQSQLLDTLQSTRGEEAGRRKVQAFPGQRGGAATQGDATDGRAGSKGKLSNARWNATELAELQASLEATVSAAGENAALVRGLAAGR